MRPVGPESLLLNAQAHPIAAEVPVSGQAIIFPRLQAARGAKELVWKIMVEQVLGAPTAASLYIAFQAGFRTTKGNEEPPIGVGGGPGGSRYNMTDVSQQWFTLNADSNPGFLPDGDFPLVVADQTVSSGTLGAAIALGDKSIRASRQYEIGTTLNIDREAFYVVGAPTTPDAGTTWNHPVISGGGPQGTGDLTSSTNLLLGWACKTHTNGQTIHAPKTYIKRVMGGFDQRLIMVPTFTGGTNPKFIVTADVLPRG